MAENITIQFKATGGAALKKTIDAVWAANERLTKGQTAYVKAIEAAKKSDIAAINAKKKLEKAQKQEQEIIIQTNLLYYKRKKQLDEVNASQINLTKSTKKLTKAQKQEQDEVIQSNLLYYKRKRQLEQATASQRNFNKSTQRGTQRLRIQTGAFATLRSNLLLYSFGIGLANKAIVSFVEKSAKIEGLERSFRSLTRGIGGSEKSLGKLREAVNNTVNDTDLMTQANNAMLLGVVKSDDEMAQLFDTAQRLGKAVGVDATDAVNSLVTGMGRQSKLMLDNLGITLDTNEAYEKYAEKIGVSVSALSDQEKKIAFNEEVLRISKDMVESLGDEHISTSEKLAQMEVATHNLQIEIGQVLTPVVHIAADAMISFSETMDSEAIRKYGTAIMGVAGAYLVFSKAGLGALKASKAFIKANKTFLLTSIAIIAVVEALDRFTNIFGDAELDGLIKDVEKSLNSLDDELDDTGKEFTHLAATVVEATQTMEAPLDAFLGQISQIAGSYSNLTMAQLESARSAELAATESIKSERRREKEVNKINEKFDAKERKAKREGQKIAELQARISGAISIMKAFEQYGPTPTGYAMAALMTANTALQIQTIRAQKFERGGMVGGRRHSQGGTLIEAERGEFVMSRSAVESVGLETMNRINEGGGAGINISFSGNVMSDEFIESEAIPKIKEAIRRGADIGVS